MKYSNISMIGDKDNYRFVLKKECHNPLFVIGINPSTANEKKPDQTLRKVMGFAEYNGFDGFVMLNVYAQRKTNPNELDLKINKKLHKENLYHIIEEIKKVPHPTILAAYGNLISKRDYLTECFNDITEALKEFNPQWKRAGKLTKENNPRHLLYTRYCLLEDFNVYPILQ